MTPLTQEKRAKIIEMYGRGICAQRIGEAVGCQPHTVTRIAVKAGLMRHRRGFGKQKLTARQEADAISRYEAGGSASAIGVDFNVTDRCILGVLKRKGVARRAAGLLRTLDESVFDTITDESAYWIGFIMADGCVCNRRTRLGTAAVFSIRLMESDGPHIERLRRFLGASAKVRPLVQADGFCGGKPSRMVQFSTHSRRLVDALSTYGVVPRKSSNAKATGGIEMNRHFWRGVIDGDGYLRERTRPVVGLVGSKILLAQFQGFAESYGAPLVKIQDRGTIGGVAYCGTFAARLIGVLYGGAEVSLPRKLRIARSVMRNAKTTVELKTHCPSGHPLVKGNLYIYGNGRHCRRCIIDASKEKHRVRQMWKQMGIKVAG